MDYSFRSAISDYLWSWGAVYKLCLVSSLCKFLGIIHSPTTSFHLQSNGIVKRFHRQLKVSLRARLAGSDWFNHLSMVLLGLSSGVPSEDSSISPSEAVYGSPLILPCEFLDSPELPSPEYLWWIQQIIKNTPVAPSHHNSALLCPVPPVPPSLLQSTHIFC